MKLNPSRVASALHHARQAQMQVPLLLFLSDKRPLVEETVFQLRRRIDTLRNPLVQKEWRSTLNMTVELLETCDE